MFIGTALSITAFPVLARILKETGLIYTRPGALVMTAAAINDAIAWCLLVVAVSVTSSQTSNAAYGAYVFLCVSAYAIIMLGAIRPVFRRIVIRCEERAYEQRLLGRSATGWDMRENMFVFSICALLASSWLTSLLGVHTIIGAFLFGLVVPRDTLLFQDCKSRIEGFVVSILLPIYFAFSGLSTDVTKIKGMYAWLMVVLVCVVATVGKLVGCGGAAYIQGVALRESAVIAILMNTRGLIELIVLNIGLTSGILNEATFAVMVIMCLFTTCLTCPLVDLIFPVDIRGRIDVEDKDGDAVVDNDDSDSERDTFSSSFERLNIVILTERAVSAGDFLPILCLFGNQRRKQHTFSATLLMLVEPSLSVTDPIIGYDAQGRLIAVRKISEGLPENDCVPLSTSNLSQIAVCCTTVGASVVAAFEISGDPSEFHLEVRDKAIEYMSNVVIFHWKSGSFIERLLPAISKLVELPVGILVDSNEDPCVDGKRRIKRVVVIVSDSPSASCILNMGARFAFSQNDAEITVLLPRNHSKTIHQSRLGSNTKAEMFTNTNLRLEKVDIDSDDFAVFL